MSQQHKLTCIVCPRGCELIVDEFNNVSGNKCNRGPKYALNEIKAPKRELSTTVKIKSKDMRRLPVKITKEIDRELLIEVMKVSNQITVSPPIYMGDVIIKDVLNLGIDFVALCDVLK